jgi:hypothetical protein
MAHNYGPMPRPPLPNLVQFFQRLVRYERRTYRTMLRAPERGLARLQQKVEREMSARSEENPDWFVNSVRELVDTLEPVTEREIRESLRAARQSMCEDPAVATLLELIDRAERRFPGSPLMAQTEFMSAQRAKLLSASAISRALEARREERAHLTVAAAGDMVELVYRSYASKVWILQGLADGTPGRPPRDFGPLVKQLAPRVSNPLLIDPLAAHIRNAAQHSHYRYVPSQRLLVLADRTGWTDNFRVDDLLARVVAMHFAGSHAYFQAMGQYLSETFLPSMVPLFQVLPQALRGELSPGEIARVSAEHDAHINAILHTVPLSARKLWGIGETDVIALPSGTQFP